jgi:hypothetical protein
MNRFNWIAAVSVAAPVCAVANANTFAGSYWTLNYNLSGQFEFHRQGQSQRGNEGNFALRDRSKGDSS